MLHIGVIICSKTVVSFDFGSKARFKIVNAWTRLILKSFLEDLIYINAFHSLTRETKGVSLSLCEETALSVQVAGSIYLVSAAASCWAEPSNGATRQRIFSCLSIFK